jgi:hypothetical protein
MLLWKKILLKSVSFRSLHGFNKKNVHDENNITLCTLEIMSKLQLLLVLLLLEVNVKHNYLYFCLSFKFTVAFTKASAQEPWCKGGDIRYRKLITAGITGRNLKYIKYVNGSNFFCKDQCEKETSFYCLSYEVWNRWHGKIDCVLSDITRHVIPNNVFKSCRKRQVDWTYYEKYCEGW